MNNQYIEMYNRIDKTTVRVYHFFKDNYGNLYALTYNPKESPIWAWRETRVNNLVPIDCIR